MCCMIKMYFRLRRSRMLSRSKAKEQGEQRDVASGESTFKGPSRSEFQNPFASGPCKSKPYSLVGQIRLGASWLTWCSGA